MMVGWRGEGMRSAVEEGEGMRGGGEGHKFAC